MILDPEGLDAHTMIKNLLRIKLKKASRDFVILCKGSLESRGFLDLQSVSRLRRIYRSNRALLSELFEANERARASMAREAMGLSKKDVSKARSELVDGLKRKYNDFGI